MNKKKSVLIICLQAIALFIFLVIPGTFIYGGKYEFDGTCTFLADIGFIRNGDYYLNGKMVSAILTILVVVFVLACLASIVVCIMHITKANRKLPEGKTLKSILCAPTILLFIILVIGRLPILQSTHKGPAGEKLVEIKYLGIDIAGYVLIFLLLAAMIIALLPDTAFINSTGNEERSITKKKPEKKKNDNEKKANAQSFRDLQNLYKEGLITEEEYNEKRKSYLDQL